jgi:hypothetical protein
VSKEKGKSLRDMLPNLLLTAATACVVLLGALLPARYFTSSWQGTERPELLAPSDRRQCWLDYYVRKAGGTGDSLLDMSAAQTQQLLDIGASVRELVAVDQGEMYVEAEGTQCLEVYSSAGTIRVWHYYIQWRGDWRNWLDLYMDADTQEIYYLYVSSGCENRQEDYAKLPAEQVLPETLARTILEEWGMTVAEIQEGADAQTVSALCRDETGSSTYQVNCSYYPGSLLDCRVQLLEAEPPEPAA